jgi:hypothetical protein
LSIIFAFSLISFAQVTTGALQGVVYDAQNAVVPGATVRLTNPQKGFSRETTTNSEGVYNFNLLEPADTYKVEVMAKGFANGVLENVSVHIGTINNGDVKLGIAGSTAEVTVTGDQGAILQTEQSQLSTAYTSKQLTQLPINGGGIETFALLTPGVVTPGDTDFTNGVGISANGNRGRSNNFQIDGQDNNDNSVAGPSLALTNTDAIGEVQVITNVFSAEFGRNSGAQVNAVTKSGTNNFHGSLFEYYSGSALNTRSNADKRQTGELKFLADNVSQANFGGLASRTKDPYHSNRFGAAVGGPIKKNKAFFFGTYQGDIQRGEFYTSNIGSDSVTFTPESAALARTLFPNAATAALVSTAVGGGPAFAQGVGPAFVVPPLVDTNGDGIVDDFAYGTPDHFSDGVYVCLVATRPCPSASVRILNFGEIARIVPNNNSDHQIITREDFVPTSRDNISVRYIYDNTKFPLATGRFTAGAIFDVPSRNHNFGTSWAHNFGATTTNEFRYNFSDLFVTFGDTKQRPGPSIGFAGTRNWNFDGSLTFGTQNNLPQSRDVKVHQFQDTFIWTPSGHNIRFGPDIRFQKVNNFFLPNFLGVYTFQGGNPFGAGTSSSGVIPVGTPLIDPFFFQDRGVPNGALCGFTPGTPGNPPVPNTCAATAFENFLLGNFRSATFALGNPEINTNQNDYFFFIQDDWKVHPRLTLNLGVRYEISTQPLNPIIDDINAREAGPNAIFNTAFPLSTRTANRVPIDKNNLAPRVGFAWSPNLGRWGDWFDHHQTVIRGGYGISYDPGFFNIVLNTVTAAPFAAAGTFQQTPGAVGSQQFPFLPSTTAQLNLTPGTNGGDPRLFNQTRVSGDFHNPFSIGYNFGIQQELSRHSVLEVRYVGTQIRDQFQTLNANPNVRFLNNAAQCLGLDPGTFSNGYIVGTPASSTASACSGGGFQNRPGTNGNGRIDPAFGPVRLRNNGAHGRYDGLQVRFDQRFGQSVIMNVNYTFSKTIDNASEIFSTGAGGQSVAVSQKFYDTDKGERGLSAFDQRHSFITNFTWEVPYFRNQKGIEGKLLGGWQMTGIIRLGSGRPYTPVEAFGSYDATFDNGLLGLGALRPFNGNSSAAQSTIAYSYDAACNVLFGGPECDYNGGAAAPGSFIIYDTRRTGQPGTVVPNIQAALQQARVIYNDFGLTTQFGLPLNLSETWNYFKTPYGDVGRNTFKGDPFYGVNLALLKTTNIGERYKLELRVEAQNLLNRRNFGVPDAFTEDASFGSFVGSYGNVGFNTGSVRQLRLGARFIF